MKRPDEVRRHVPHSAWVAFLLLLLPGPVQATWQTFRTGDGLPDNDVRAMAEDGNGNLWFHLWGHDGAGSLARFDGAAWRVFGKESGLGTWYVSAIYVDRSGFLWAATLDAGARRFDDPGWTAVTADDGLADNNVTAILEDRAGRMWFASSGGSVSVLDHTQWTTFSTAHGLSDRSVIRLYEDSRGSIWALHDGWPAGGVSRYDGTRWHFFGVEDGLPDFSGGEIAEDPSGNIWVGILGGGLARYDGTTWWTFPRDDTSAESFIGAIVADRDGDIWVGTISEGVGRFDGTNWVVFGEEAIGSAKGRTLLEDRDGNIWVGTSGGAARFDGTDWRVYTPLDGLGSDDVEDILQDHVGNLWFGTLDGGASRFDGSGWITYTTADGLAGDTVLVAYVDREEDLWFGTAGGGISRFDGETWTTYTQADGLVSDEVGAILQDRSGVYWFGSDDGGVTRFDGAAWAVFGRDSELGSDQVYDIIEDREGRVWFGTSNGAVRLDGSTWVTYTDEDGLVDDHIYAILQDRLGRMWFGTENGVSRFDGQNWVTYRYREELAGRRAVSLFEDHRGHIWVGFFEEDEDIGGVSRYDGQSWMSFSVANGLGDTPVWQIAEDRWGNLWFANLYGGAVRYDGQEWVRFGREHGIAGGIVTSIAEDAAGDLWFGTAQGVSRYEPDRVAPQTVVVSAPPSLATSRTVSFSYSAAYNEAVGITFAYSFDDGVWSSWSPFGMWSLAAVSDGNHVFQVKARDRLANVDPTPAVVKFEIDATPPSPIIARPFFGEAIRDSVPVLGTADDERFREYRLEIRSIGGSSWETPAGMEPTRSVTSVRDSVLATWETGELADGEYQLRLSVTDTLGLTGVAIISVIVDNEPPWVDQTSPARIRARVGGDLYSADGLLHLYFPPNALTDDAVVTATVLGPEIVPDILAGGERSVSGGYEIAWGGVPLAKAATLELVLPREEEPGREPVIYVLDETSSWNWLGGTVAGSPRAISTLVSRPGSYALFVGGVGPAGGDVLSELTLNPRVFSPTGTFATSSVGIGFSLGRPGSVTVRVYSRSGKLVREVVRSEPMDAGANLVRWDGHDRSGLPVSDGLYLVTVEALGHTETTAIAVVR